MSSPQDPNVRQQPAVAATGGERSAILATQELTKKFGGLTAVDSVDLSIAEGEIRCLIGPNGAGKSTLLELITGQLSPTAGDIYFDGINLTTLDPHKRVDAGISVKFQSPHVYESLTVRQNLRVPLQRTNQSVEPVLSDTLDRISLKSKVDKPASDLSHGEKQRLEIGMALTLDPTLMLLDEPVAGMSIDETDDIADLIRSLHADGMTFLIVEHDMKFVRQVSQQVTVLNQGSIFRQGPIEEIQSDDDVRRIYLGEDA